MKDKNKEGAIELAKELIRLEGDCIEQDCENCPFTKSCFDTINDNEAFKKLLEEFIKNAEVKDEV